MIYRIAELFDWIEREKPKLIRIMTSNWNLLWLGLIVTVIAWKSGLSR